MNDPVALPTLRSRVPRRAAFLVVALLLAGIAWDVVRSRRKTGESGSGPAGGVVRARDPYADSPYRNAHPGVAYVGDAACARCHREIAEAYRTHPMGRSLAAIGGPGEPPTGTGTGLPVEAKGLRYTIERRDGRVFHKATRTGAGGAVLAEIEAEVRFALGSGTRGVNFLIERDGFLFMSPIAWFAQQGRWDISPGFGEAARQTNFERAIYPDCLFCHADRVRPVAGTLNRYETPIFRSHAIGCERCHGPGELHADRGGLSDESIPTIVNPSALAPALRESVCQQCHLQGAYRTTRAGREPFDFRPGLPLHRFFAVYQMERGGRGQFEAVGHVEQMESSRCFRESGGQLGCISCHDPHRLPEASTKGAYYRDRCMECHDRRGGLALPSAERQARGRGEDCVACHMPRLSLSNVAHTAATDHRISRGGTRPAPERSRSGPGRPGEIPLVDFHRDQMTEDERRDAGRDLGVASAWVARRMAASPGLAKVAAAQAIPLLEAGIRERPDDSSAAHSLGTALELLGRGDEAVRAFEGYLRLRPNDELALRESGRLLAGLHRPDEARAAIGRAVAVNPWRPDYRLALAQVCSQGGHWREAIAACREAIRLDPNLFDARTLLVESYWRAGDREKADAEFRTMVRFYPASREIWEQWYERLRSSG